VGIADRLVDLLEQPDERVDVHAVLLAGELAPQQLEVGPELEEGETPPQRVVDERDRAVRGVHRAEDPHVARHLQPASGR